jgi:N-acetylglucosaminyldiphosphoundecaprenol N-acetyl-beta-D-mannosaminyltransferase
MTVIVDASSVANVAHISMPVTDFDRKVYCVLGLIFDAVTIDGAEMRIRDAIVRKQRCYLTTPNVNNVVAAQKDFQFRDSISRSNLSVADGMPIIWVAKLLGIPVASRVAGSTLFERLRQQTTVPVKVFFFGGPDGAAQRAEAALNADHGLMTCVGGISPGFGSLADLSSDKFIDQINAAHPDFVVVSLGSQRGSAWIEHNFERLDAPVISHLGAVVNFVAGTISRAPPRLANSGLEWLWRIKEEPTLWRRYYQDGTVLLKMIATQVLPYFLQSMVTKLFGRRKSGASVDVLRIDSVCTITLGGAWDDDRMPEFRRAFAEVIATPADIVLDLKGVTSINNACVALLVLLYGHQTKVKQTLTINAVSSQVKRMIRLCGVAYLLENNNRARSNGVVGRD